MTLDDWDSGYARSLGVFLNGHAITEPGPRGEAITDCDFLLLFNADSEPVAFTLPSADLAGAWQVVVDTASAEAPPPSSGRNGAGQQAQPGGPVQQPGSSLPVAGPRPGGPAGRDRALGRERSRPARLFTPRGDLWRPVRQVCGHRKSKESGRRL